MDNSTPRLRRAGAQVGLILLLAALAEGASAHPRYTVQWGDTLTGIASRHGTSVSALARLNGLDPTNLLLSGTSLRLPSSGADAAGTHVVRAGETLSGIAARYGTSVAALVQANGLASANLILAGAPLRIPGSSPQSELAGAGPKSAWGITAAIDFWSGEYGVDPRLSRALAWMESGFQTNVTSTASAWGVMQVTPDAWVFVEEVLLGARVPRTAEGNVRVGVAYLGHLLRQVGGNERRALAAYYQGLRSVRTEGLFPETRNYVADVLALKGRV